MIPAPFEYVSPTTLEEATGLLATRPGAKVLAGGMSLIPAMKHRLATPGTVVDIGRVRGLDGVIRRRGQVVIGALATHASILASADLSDLPVFAETASVIGDVQVRNRGTLGGSLVHADPAADWPAVFLALDGEAVVVGPRGERTIAARSFFRGILTSAVEPREILTEVRLPVQRGRTGAAYLKFRQPASGFAIVGVAAFLGLDRRGRCERVSIAITGANPVPFRAASVEGRLVGHGVDEEAVSDLCAPIEELDPLEDVHASGEYRRHLASVLLRRALARAAARAGR